MRAARPRTELFAIGRALDRAVHQTFSRFWLVVPPFVIADALGSIGVLGAHGILGNLAAVVGGMTLVNRARVTLVATLAQPEPQRILWRAATRHVTALVFVLAGVAEIVVPYLALLFVAAPFALIRIIGPLQVGAIYGAAYAGGVILAMIVAGLLLAGSLVAIFACAAAMVDVVLERVPLGRALGRWLRRSFRRSTFGSTLLAAAAFVALAAGTPIVLGLLPQWAPHPVQSCIDAIPEGIADAIAMLFAWRWRDAILEQREGRDLEALLARDQSVSVSPTASSPGVTTSQ